MKALVISDLHSNAEAVRAVTQHVRRKKYDHVICLGDFVGYGAQPNQVLDVIRAMKGKKLYLRGNHDRVAAGLDDAAAFNAAAKYAVLWTRDHLSGPNRRFLRDLPLGPLEYGDVMLCHGSPHDEDEYVFNEYHAAQVLGVYKSPIIFYGHTHLPVIFEMDRELRVRGWSVRDNTTVRLDPAKRYLINPGSVGQPRDRDPRASFALYDQGKRTVQFFRVEYDVKKTQESIVKAGLPSILAHRLSVGT